MFLKKIFCKRRVLIITDEEITSYPISTMLQVSFIIVIASIISCVSFLSGKYVFYKNEIKYKETEVQKTNIINLNLQSKIDDLQGNLVRLNNYFSTVKEFDYNKKNNRKKRRGKKTSKLNDFLNKAKLSSLNLQKITDPFGEQYSKRVDSNKKKQILDSINSNTKERIANIKKIISITGLSVLDDDGAVGKKGKAKNNINEIANLTKINSFKNQGGPDTSNITSLKYGKIKNLAGDLHFSKNIDKLLYLENIVNALPLTSPIKRYYISSNYGHRTDPVTQRRARHFGADLVGRNKADVYSAAKGKVIFAGKKGNYGNFVEIDHGYNVITRYGHLDRLHIKKGDIVTRKTIIAQQGNTGRSTGAHLHYEIRFNGKPLNPVDFIKAGKYVF